jgi:hypothetical protein
MRQAYHKQRAPTEADALIEETLISPFIALLHLFHGLLGVVLRIEGAERFILPPGLWLNISHRLPS